MGGTKGSLSDKADPLVTKKADPLVKNAWRWEWLDLVHDGQKLSDFIRVVKKPGYCVCTVCDKEIKYAGRGRVSMVDHVKNESHKRIIRERKSNTLLPGKLKIICFIIRLHYVCKKLHQQVSVLKHFTFHAPYMDICIWDNNNLNAIIEHKNNSSIILYNAGDLSKIFLPYK